MDLGTFLSRAWIDFWIVFWLGIGLLLAVSAIRHVVKGRWLEALLPLFGTSALGAMFLAANAIQVLWR